MVRFERSKGEISEEFLIYLEDSFDLNEEIKNQNGVLGLWGIPRDFYKETLGGRVASM